MYIILMIMSFGSLVLTDPCQGQLLSKEKFDPHLFQSVEERKTVLVSVQDEGGQSHSDILRGFDDDSVVRQFVSRSDRLQTVVTLLEDYATKSQRGILEFLNNFLKTSHHHYDDDGNEPTLDKPVEIIPLWITNRIIVKQASLSLVRELALRSDVSKIEEDKIISLLDDSLPDLSGDEYEPLTQINMHTWGVKKVKAVDAWKAGVTGAGIVVGVIDSGVRASHDLLKDAFIGGEYGWFDAAENSSIPIDTMDHGSHVTGSICGQKGIGVAPDAKFIACRACNKKCYGNYMLQCVQCMSCPTRLDGKKDCSKAPHIVSGSWGFPGDIPAIEDGIRTWRAQGIIPVFGVGNYGGCGTLISPGWIPEVIGVGSTDREDRMADGSSCGPAPKKYNGIIKPDLVAPGHHIVSVANDDDTRLSLKGGTSMACPHVSGVVALLLSKNRSLTFDQVKEALIRGCEPVSVTTKHRNCGGLNDTQHPNFHSGYGRVNVLKSLVGL